MGYSPKGCKELDMTECLCVQPIMCQALYQGSECIIISCDFHSCPGLSPFYCVIEYFLNFMGIENEVQRD